MRVLLLYICLFLTNAEALWAQNDKALKHGYTRQGDFIFLKGERIDQAGKKDIDQFSRAAGRKLILCSDVDAASFQVLSEEYTKDKNKVYYKWISPGRFWVVELPEADAATFESVGFNLARDKNHVWWYGAVQRGVDATTVKVVNDGFVWKDAQNVWYQHQQIVGANSKTFRHAGSGYYIDANGAYWGGDLIVGADPATFKVLGNSFVAVDRSSVYRSGQRQPHLDAGTCKFILHDPYGYQVISDKNGVYLNNLKILHAVPDDFAMIDRLTGRGGKYVFLVDTWHCTPVTVYREDDRLITETVLYEKGTTNALAVIKAEIASQKLKNMTLSGPTGEASAHQVPKWQIDIFQRADMIKRMNRVSKLLE